jgi:hypothetical protein
VEEKKLSKDNEKKELSVEKLEEIEKAYLDLMKAYASSLSPLYLKKNYISASYLKLIYSFSWDNVPGEDDKILIKFLKDNLHIGWAENAEISKSDDETIRIIKDENSVIIKIDKKKKKAILTISDGRTHDLKVKKKHGKLNINPKIKHGAWLDLQKGFYKKRWLDSQKELYKKYGTYYNEKWVYRSFTRVSGFINWIAYRIVRLKIRKGVDRLREVFLLLIIAQNRNKIDPRVIKKFEIYSEDMDRLSAQFAKYSFYAIIIVVGSWLSVVVSLLIGIATNALENATNSSENIFVPIAMVTGGYLLFLAIIYFTFSFYISKRVFSETAVTEKQRKIFVLIQEYLELA